MTTITIQDESATGKVLNQILIDLEQEVITVKELIQTRVKIEVDKYNNKQEDKYMGLVQPTHYENELNSNGQKKRKLVDAEKQFYIALEAFKNNGFFILVDNRQITDLQEEIVLTEQTPISFIKLTPLVGG